MSTEHRPGCEALGGYGHGVGPCSCGASPVGTETEALRLADALKGHAPMATRDEAAAMLRKLVAERKADRAAMRRALDVMDEAMNYTNSAAHSPSMTRELLAAITDLRQRLEGTT